MPQVFSSNEILTKQALATQ